jgi:hypothetical protein
MECFYKYSKGHLLTTLKRELNNSTTPIDLETLKNDIRQIYAQSLHPGENNRNKPEMVLAATGGRRGGMPNEWGNKRFGQPERSRNGHPRFKTFHQLETTAKKLINSGY